MADVRLLIQEEGRTARNLIAFNVPMVMNNTDKITRKPPSVPRVVQSAPMKRSIKTTARVRSASTGRDKKSELQARYWAFLFGNLQRAVDGIYQTCEEDESISECKEVILVLENYTRDFHNLIEWFKVKWAYESTPPPLRRVPLAWEVRKTSPGRVWGSQGGPKSVSPVQRMSPTGPTCRSPVDQTIVENKPIVIDNKISLIKEESVFKAAKDNKNITSNVSRNDAKNVKEKCKNIIEKGPEPTQNKGKSVPSKVATRTVLKRPVAKKNIDHGSTDSNITSKPTANDTKSNLDIQDALKPSVIYNQIVDTKNAKKQTNNDAKSVRKPIGSDGRITLERLELEDGNEETASEIENGNKINAEAGDSNRPPTKNNKADCTTSLEEIPFAIDSETHLEMRNNKINAENEDSNKLSPTDNKLVLETDNGKLTTVGTEKKLSTDNKTITKPTQSKTDLETTFTKCINESSVSNNEITQVYIQVTDNALENMNTTIIETTARKADMTVDSQTAKKLLSVDVKDSADNKLVKKCASTMLNNISSKPQQKPKSVIRPAYSTVSRMRPSTAQPPQNLPETPKLIRSKTTLSVKGGSNMTRVRPGTSVMVRRRIQPPVPNKVTEQCVKGDQNNDLSGSVEVLTKQTTNAKTKDEGDGWQTVRSRYRRGSTHNLNMATRFHKPSTAMSLPALSIESPSEKCKTNCLTPDGNQRTKKKPINGKTGKNIINEVEKVTKGDFKLKDKVNDNFEKSDNTSLTSLGESISTSMIAAIFKSEAELLERRIQQFVAAQAERERVILEEERKREEADSQRSQQLSDEEASLKRQIQELESTEIDVDTETDETDGETVLEMEGDEPLELLTDTTDDISLEDRYENMLEGMSWAERVDTLAQLQALVARHPGRALELHQKLSSPSRKRSLPETLRRYQAKQACAQRKRQTLLMEKSQRLRELLNKVEDVKSAKNQLIEDKRVRMEMKLKRAEENRTQHLLEIVRKAHDEDSKLKEIAFINELEAQNKRHDFMTLCQEQEERLQGIQEERQRRQEEKAAKEAAAEERRRALEVERQLRIQRMRQTRREREERVGKMQLEREKERQELAREKARDREERLSALHAAQLANQEELQKKIAHKQQESARRHGENIEHIRQRAVESSILRSEEVPPTLKFYPAQKQCSLCDALIPNEVHLLSHLKGKSHLDAVRKMHDGREPPRDELQRFNIAQIRDIPLSLINNNNVNNNKAAKEKQKALKRRCRKMKQRIAARGQEWEDAHKSEILQSAVESANKAKFRRNLKELDRLCNNHGKTTWPSVAVAGLERCLGEIMRAFDKYCVLDQDAFNLLNGFVTLTNLLNLGLNVQNMSHCLPNKSVVSACKVYKAAVHGHLSNAEGVLLSNKILVILDLLLQRTEAATGCDDHNQESSNNANGSGNVATAVIQLLCSLFAESSFEKPALQGRLQDIVGYLVAGGLVERVARHSRALIEMDSLLDQDHESPLLLASLELLSRICSHLKRCSQENTQSENNNSEQTSSRSHLLTTLKSTEAAGAVGALYAALVLPSHNQKGSSPTPNQTGPPSATRALTARALTFLRTVAELDLPRLQELLGAESTSLQFRLVASQLIARLSRDSQSDKADVGTLQNFSGHYILTELFTVIGYFALNNQENQMVLQSGGTGPSVLQQLCSLPFPFYGDPRLASSTLPTLLAATHRNTEATAVLSCELSYQLLEEYRSSEEGKENPLVRLLKDGPSL